MAKKFSAPEWGKAQQWSRKASDAARIQKAHGSTRRVIQFPHLR
jgi:hypothetical protein